MRVHEWAKLGLTLQGGDRRLILQIGERASNTIALRWTGAGHGPTRCYGAK